MTVNMKLQNEELAQKGRRKYQRLHTEKNSDIVFFDESADSLLAIDQMKLVVSRSTRPPEKELIFISMSEGGSVGESGGVYLDPSQDRGWIDIPSPQMDNRKNYELAPETCQALKQRIVELQKRPH